jgi:hypothetical protein
MEERGHLSNKYKDESKDLKRDIWAEIDNGIDKRKKRLPFFWRWTMAGSLLIIGSVWLGINLRQNQQNTQEQFAENSLIKLKKQKSNAETILPNEPKNNAGLEKQKISNQAKIGEATQIQKNNTAEIPRDEMPEIQNSALENKTSEPNSKVSIQLKNAVKSETKINSEKELRLPFSVKTKKEPIAGTKKQKSKNEDFEKNNRNDVVEIASNEKSVKNLPEKENEKTSFSTIPEAEKQKNNKISEIVLETAKTRKEEKKEINQMESSVSNSLLNEQKKTENVINDLFAKEIQAKENIQSESLVDTIHDQNSQADIPLNSKSESQFKDSNLISKQEITAPKTVLLDSVNQITAQKKSEYFPPTDSTKTDSVKSDSLKAKVLMQKWRIGLFTNIFNTTKDMKINQSPEYSRVKIQNANQFGFERLSFSISMCLERYITSHLFIYSKIGLLFFQDQTNADLTTDEVLDYQGRTDEAGNKYVKPIFKIERINLSTEKLFSQFELGLHLFPNKKLGIKIGGGLNYNLWKVYTTNESMFYENVAKGITPKISKQVSVGIPFQMSRNTTIEANVSYFVDPAFRPFKGSETRPIMLGIGFGYFW